METQSIDDSNSQNSAGKDDKKRSWSNIFLMLAISLPMIAAYVMYATGIGIPTGTVNKGDLLLPATSIASLAATKSDGSSALDIGERKLWRVITVGNDSCSEECKNLLYLSRQVHIRLGEKSVRVERLFLHTGSSYSADFSQWLSTEHPQLVQARVDAEQWRTLMAGSSIAEHRLDGSHIYIIDQEGFAMLSFNSQHEGADLLTDLKRLLRYSYGE